MTFAFNGAGSKADVIHQIRSHHGYDDQGLAVAARELIVHALEAHEEDDNYVYKVSANGHAGYGGATSLEIKIEPMWVPSIREIPAAAEVDGIDLGIPDRPQMGEHASI